MEIHKPSLKTVISAVLSAGEWFKVCMHFCMAGLPSRAKESLPSQARQVRRARPRQVRRAMTYDHCQPPTHPPSIAVSASCQCITTTAAAATATTATAASASCHCHLPLPPLPTLSPTAPTASPPTAAITHCQCPAHCHHCYLLAATASWQYHNIVHQRLGLATGLWTLFWGESGQYWYQWIALMLGYRLTHIRQ
jgi:hypothetical protein